MSKHLEQALFTRVTTILLLIGCMLSGSNYAAAQKIKQRIPIISLGGIPNAEFKDGKLIPSLTTRQKIFKYWLLVGDLYTARVTEFKYSMIIPGEGFYGPIYVTGGGLTDSIKNKIKITEGPGVKIYIEDIKMLYKDEILDGNPIYLTYDK